MTSEDDPGLPPENGATAEPGGTVVPRAIEAEMKTSYIDYAMSVIVGRALPDARDGLKPVHRRILYAMNELGLSADKPYKKSARVVGEVLGKYHPHGDTAVYDTMVRMAQDFSLRYMLVDGQGNFGSVDGDNAAAMRYTEARLSKIAHELLEDIDRETVDFAPNFDATLEEPVVLPAKFPNLLVNGSTGIAVGMATNMPPHNLGEVIDALKIQLERPDVTVQELLQVMPGPDFPTGGTIHGRAGIMQAYAQGRGVVKVRAKARVEDMDNGERIIVDEIPYMVNKANLITSIADLVKEKRLEGIRDLRDESDRDGMRIVIELKRDANADVVLNNLYKHTQMESSFGILNLALVDNQPQVLPLKGLLQAYLDHRVVVVTRRTRFLLRKAEERLHIVKGLLLAVGAARNLDRIVAIIRESADVEEARRRLVEETYADVGIPYVPTRLDEEQAKAILDLRLSKLTGLEVRKLRDEGEDLVAKIADYQDILARPERVRSIIATELTEIREKYADKRRTEIVEGGADIDVEDLIPDEHVVVTITNDGYIKRIPIDQYRLQGRGGKGLIGITTKEQDFVTDTFVTTTHRYVLFFTNKGRVHWLKGWQIPESQRQSKGKAIVNLLQGLDEGESISAAIPVEEFRDDRYLFFATRKGLVKKTVLSEYARPRVTGIIAVGIEEDDELVGVAITHGEDDIFLVKNLGKGARFHESEVRPMGRPAFGVKGVECRSGEKVVSMVVVQDPQAELLTVTARGKGKRTPLTAFAAKGRGIWGVYTHDVDFDTGELVGALEVKEGDEILLATRRGIMIRLPVAEIRLVTSAKSKGVILQSLGQDDVVVSLARLSRDDLDASIEEQAARLKKLEQPLTVSDLPFPEDEAADEGEREERGLDEE